jgi:hypothetical protein
MPIIILISLTDYLTVGGIWQNIGFYAILLVLAWILTNQFALLKRRNSERQKPR